MALSPEHKQTLEALAQHEESRAVIETALFLLESDDTTSRRVDVSTHDTIRRQWELQRSSASVTTDPETGEEGITFSSYQEKLAVNLSRSFLTLSILHTDAPLELGDYPHKKLFLYPRVSIGINAYGASVTAASLSNAPALTHIKEDTGWRDEEGRKIYNFLYDDEFSVEAFEQILIHTTAELGLYHRAHELRRAA